MPMWQSVQAMLSWEVLFLNFSWQSKQSSDRTAAPTGELRIRKKMMTKIGIVSRIEQERSSTRRHNKFFTGFVKKKYRQMGRPNVAEKRKGRYPDDFEAVKSVNDVPNVVSQDFKAEMILAAIRSSCSRSARSSTEEDASCRDAREGRTGMVAVKGGRPSMPGKWKSPGARLMINT